ncbi:MAG: glycosyltransferase [Treponema sp.]|nr:glycosyltransferase [Treponema sp.]
MKPYSLARFLFNLPWYISNGYIKKVIQQIRYDGLKGIKGKIKRALNSNVRVAPVLAFADNDARQIYCGQIPPLNFRKPASRHTETIDIIICVHNAYEDAKHCIESVFKFTLEPFRIILVDDGSGEQTRDYLISLLMERPNVKLFRNEYASGYTRAANIGLKFSDAEYCLLLNSDTIVTEGWLDKMIKCQKSGDNIGIVSALSNTASWQSVPEVSNGNGDWAHNRLPEDIGLEQFSELLDKGAKQLYPRLPLLNGFCLMIHRSVIDSIGYFDEENFGNGFGEEDDYNLRAGKAGFQLALADDTFIFHAQSKSYSDERRIALCNENGVKLRKKHGDALLDTSVHIMKYNFVLEGIRTRTRIVAERERLIKNARERWVGKRILFLLHANSAGGGGNVIIQEARSMIKMGIDVRIYNLKRFRNGFEASYPDLDIPVIYGDRHGSFRKFASEFDIVCATAYYTVQECDFSSLGIIKTRPAYYIQDFEPYFLEEGDPEYGKAIKSYTSIPEMTHITKTEWNRLIVEHMTGAKATVIGKSVDIDLYCPRKLFPNRDKTIIAAMVRPDSPRRAPELTLEVMNEIAKTYGDKAVILVFGSDPKESFCDKDFWNANYKDPQVINLGKLSRYEMASLLSCVDVFADFSSFQAMGLTSMEAMACGCGVIVPKNGGSTEFVVDGKNGIVVDSTDKAACLKALRRLIDDHEYLYKLAYQAAGDICGYYPEKSAYKLLEACFE